MTELDLDAGDPSAAEKILSEGQAARATRTRGRSSSDSSSGKGKPKTAAFTEAEDKSLHGRLATAFQDLAETAKGREDLELADILERRKDAMAQGLVSLTRNIRVLRGPLVLLINFLEPTLAFWELATLGINRYIARQQRKRWERQQGQPIEAEVI